MNKYLDILESWVNIESISGNEAGFLETLQAAFETRGWACRRQEVAPNRWNLIIGNDKTKFVYSTHVDTVPPFLPVNRTADAIYGRGACDTKGGIVAMMAAGDRLLEEGIDDFGYLFVVGEEVDHCGAKKAPDADVNTGRIILCEPTINRVVAAQKGMIKLILTAEGIAGHSAYPERGVSAVHRLLETLEKFRHHDWPTNEILGETTYNVGVINGGVAANVFAPTASAQVLFRTVSETKPLMDVIAAACGEGVTFEVPASNDPVFFDPPEGVETCTANFNTDASYLNPIAPVWLVGPGDIQIAHSDGEHITFSDIEAGIDLYAKLGRLAVSA